MAEANVLPRLALVTGSASGLGYAVAERLLATGASVAIGDLDTVNLGRATKGLNSPKLLQLKLDVTSPESVRSAVKDCSETFGGLDTLVNSAGISDFSPLDEMSEKNWNRVIAVNLKGVFLCCQAAAPLLREGEPGRISSVSSDAGKKGVALISSYCAAKFGVIGFAKAIAGELAPYGTTVNLYLSRRSHEHANGPGGLGSAARTDRQSVEQVLQAREQTVPVGRMATTADVVHAITFFISDESSFLTGEALDAGVRSLSTSLVPGIGES